MTIDRRSLIKGACITATAPALSAFSLGGAMAQGDTIKIGVLTDQSGLYRDLSGVGSIACVNQAVQEFANHGIRVDVLSADHQNRPDVGANVARQWYDAEGVDVIIDVPSTAVALAVSQVSRDKDRVLLASGPATSALTGRAGSPNTIHWTYNTAMLGASTGGALAQQGDNTWFFITTNTPIGTDLERDAAAFVQRAGGSVVGSVRLPANLSPDLSTSLREAQARRAKVVALATVGDMTAAAVSQTAELKRQQVKVAALQMFISDVHGLGLTACQKILLTETFYWDLNNRTRAFASRFEQRLHNRRPGMVQAGCYSAVLHYLKAVIDMGGVSRAKASGRDVVAHMKAMPTDDDAFGPGRIRDDGRKLHPAHVFEVKTPSESHGPWDYYRLIHTTSADEAFGYNPDTTCVECKSGCRCQNTCNCLESCCPK